METPRGSGRAAAAGAAGGDWLVVVQAARITAKIPAAPIEAALPARAIFCSLAGSVTGFSASQLLWREGRIPSGEATHRCTSHLLLRFSRDKPNHLLPDRGVPLSQAVALIERSIAKALPIGSMPAIYLALAAALLLLTGP
jgi:hypothetical protein